MVNLTLQPLYTQGIMSWYSFMGSWVVSLTLQPLYTQENMSWYSLYGKLGGHLDAPAALHPRKYVLVLIEWEAGWATEWSARRSSRFTPKELCPGTHCMGSWVVSLTLQPLYTQGNISWYSLNGKLGGLQNGQLDAPAALHPRKYVLVLIEWELGWTTE